MHVHIIFPILTDLVLNNPKLTISYNEGKLKFVYNSTSVKFNKQINSFNNLLGITNERELNVEDIPVNQLGFIGFDSINFVNTFTSKETLINSFDHIFNSSRYYEHTFLVFKSQDNFYLLPRTGYNTLKVDASNFADNPNVSLHTVDAESSLSSYLDVLKGIMLEDEFNSLIQSYSELNLQASLYSKVTGDTILRASEVQLDLLTLLVSYILDADPSLKANLLQKYPEIEDMLKMMTSNYIFNIEPVSNCLESLKDRGTARKYLDAYYRDNQSLKNA